MNAIVKRMKLSGMLVIGPDGDSVHVPWTSLSPQSALWYPTREQRRIHPWLPWSVAQPQHLLPRLKLNQRRREFACGTLDERLVVKSPLWGSVFMLAVGVALMVFLTVGTVRFLRKMLDTWTTYREHLPDSFLAISLVVAVGTVLVWTFMGSWYFILPIKALRRHCRNPRVAALRFRSDGLVVEQRDGQETFHPWTALTGIRVGRLAFGTDQGATIIDLPYLQARQWRPLVTLLRENVLRIPAKPIRWRAVVVRGAFWCVLGAIAAEWTTWHATRLTGADYVAGMGTFTIVALAAALSLQIWWSIAGEQRYRRFARRRQRRARLKRERRALDKLARRESLGLVTPEPLCLSTSPNSTASATTTSTSARSTKPCLTPSGWHAPSATATSASAATA